MSDTAQTFHFKTYETATRLHLARELKARGWKAGDACAAAFTEKNLCMDDYVSNYFENKYLLAELLQKAKVDFFPLTYHLNDQNFNRILSAITLKHHFIDHVYYPRIEGLIWILKPATLNNGDEIKLFDDLDQIKKYFKSTKRVGGDYVLQRYIHNPKLYGNRKFTFRICAVFTNFMGIYLYKKGYVNISGFPYCHGKDITNRNIHITNYVLDGDLSEVEQKISDQFEYFDKHYLAMFQIVSQCAKLLIEKYPDYLKENDLKKVEFFGFDFILDDNDKLWLLEINQTPDCPIDPEHPMMSTLWIPYWAKVVDNFILPSVFKNTPKIGTIVDFDQVLDYKKCTSTWYNRMTNALSNCLQDTKKK